MVGNGMLTERDSGNALCCQKQVFYYSEDVEPAIQTPFSRYGLENPRIPIETHWILIITILEWKKHKVK